MNIEEVKEITNNIINEVEDEYNIKINVFPVTHKEYYKDILLKNNANLSIINRINYFINSPRLLLTSGGFNNLKGTSIIFLNNTKSALNERSEILNFIFFVYHEARHSIQQTFDKYSYDNFLYELDKYFLTNLSTKNDYNKNHDDYSFEIGANLYGVRKAKDYLMKNYPDIYNKDKDKIEQIEFKYTLNYMTYDLCDIIDNFISANKSWNTPINENLSYFVDIFLNKKMKYKKVREIINNPNFNKIDKKIIYAFFSTKTFLKKLDINTLNDEEKNILKESLSYTNKVYNNQKKYLSKDLFYKFQNYNEYMKRVKKLQERLNKSQLLIKIFLLNLYENNNELESNDYFEEVNKGKKKCLKFII